jgi:hypothetical protein
MNLTAILHVWAAVVPALEVLSKHAEQHAGSSSSSPQSTLMAALDRHSQRLQNICAERMLGFLEATPLLEAWRAQQQQQHKAHKGSSKGKGRKGPASPALPQLPADAAAAVSRLVSNLKDVADLICAGLPSRFCCNAPGCVNLSAVIEGFGLVRGPGCVCGGCGQAR